jgi:hypothetical protein
MSEQKSKLVCLRPDYETATHWGQYWFKDQVLKLADVRGIEYYDLYGANDYKAYFNEVMKQSNAKFVCGIGHGNDFMIVGHNNQTLLDVRNSDDLQLMQDKHGSFLSCNFGSSAKVWVQKGMLSFFGYKVTYYFVTGNYPNSFAEPFFKSHCCYDREILQGTQPTIAFSKTSDAYDQEIVRQPDWVARYLISDRDGMVLEFSDNRSPFAPAPQKIKCYFCEFECTDVEVMKAHIIGSHCPPCPPWPDPCWLPSWLRDWLGCKLP